jgi:hypothetical protein
MRMPMGIPSWKADVLARVARVKKMRDLEAHKARSSEYEVHYAEPSTRSASYMTGRPVAHRRPTISCFPESETVEEFPKTLMELT